MHHAQPSDESDPLQRGLAEAFGEGEPARGRRPGSPSVLGRLQGRVDAALGVHLDAREPDDAPVRVTDEAKQLRDPSGRYQVLGEIGRGGVGVVFKGRDHDLGRDVAMKVLRDEYASHPDVLARFVEEAQIGGQLQHPGIVPVYELGLQAGERPYFAMKLVKGETLAAQLARRASPTAERRRLLGVFEQVCQTVAYAHARRVIHRDLKPANVMIGAFGEVQVVDWGFAKVLAKGGVADEAQPADRASERSVIETVRSQPGSGSHSVAGSMMGTPAYMPPEQALGDVERMDARSDVFALGAILCEILTGAPPYREQDGDLARQASVGALDGAIARLAECGADEALVGLCKESLARTRRARPESAAEVAERVGAYLTSVEERAREAELAAAEARYRTRSTRISAAATLAVVVLGAGTWIWMQGEAQERRNAAAQRVAAATSAASEARGRAQAQAAGLEPTLWEAAVASAAQAVELAAGDDVGEETRAEAATLLEAVEEERAAAAAEAARIARDETMLARLETLRIPVDEDVHWRGWWIQESRRLDAEYAAAFAEYLSGADVLARSAEHTLATLRHGDLEPELAASLDHWGLVRDGLREQDDAPDPAGTARLRELSTLLDSTDPWRTRLRALLPRAEEAGAELLALADEADFESLTAAGCRVLHVALWRAAEEDAAVEALRRAREMHPQDFDLCFRLAFALGQLPEPRWEEAVATYRIAHALRPMHAEVLHRMGLLLLRRLDRFEDAERVFARLVERDHDEVVHWLRHLASAIVPQGRDEEAFELVRRALDLAPDDSHALNSMGSAHWRRGDAQEAEKYFLQAIERDPRNGEAHTNLGILYKRWRRHDDAIDHARTAVDINPEDFRFLTNLGAASMERGDLDEAILWTDRGLELEPDDPMLLTNRGNAVRLGGDAEEALPWYERALASDPGHALAHLGNGNTLSDLGRVPEALAAYRRAIIADPKLGAAQHNLARELRLGGDLAQAVTHYRLAVAAEPWDVTFRTALAGALIDQGLLDEAEGELGEALSVDPDDPDSLLKLGRVHGELGRLQEAESTYRRAIDVLEGRGESAGRPLNPRELELLGEGHGNLGIVLVRLNRPVEAIRSHRRSLAIDPENPIELNNLGYAQWAAGQQVEALASYREALELDRDFLVARDNLSTALAQLGRFEEAIPEFHRLIEIDPTFANGHFNLGIALRQVGDLDGALEALEEAARLCAEQQGQRARQLGALAARHLDEIRRIPQLEAVLAGGRAAASSAEWAAAVDRAHRQGRYDEVVALTLRTLESEPDLPGDESWHTYNSACAAARLVAEPDSSAAERARARELARTWLDSELARWATWMEEGGPSAAVGRRRLRHSLQDPDLAGLRGPALADLPDDEREAWQELWSVIEATLAEQGR